MKRILMLSLFIYFNDAIKRFQEAASEEKNPLYVLIWGSMVNFGEVLRTNPELSKNIRVITIGTNLVMEAHRPHLPELYVIDTNHDLDNPTQSSWAGKFTKPFPIERPNYYTDLNGHVEWDYVNPCNTWENHIEMNAYAKSTLEERRPEMYYALLKKLDEIYKN